ncbi:MAG: Gfo/Idh/MocA family oxidoreductase [Chitinophagaceae bacterium]
MQTIKTALASFGMSGWVFHAPFLHHHPGYELYAVWERSKNLAEEKYPGIITYRTYDEMLAHEAIELVIVNTPNYTHFDLAKRALLAGKHVVVEKPFTITSVEGLELIELAGKQNKKVSVFQNRRWDSDFKTVKKVVDEHLLGDIVEAEIHFDRFNEMLSPKAHKETPGPGTGILYDLGSHLVDQALCMFGLPEALFADLDTMRPHSGVDDYMDIVLFYPRMRVRIHGSYFVREPLPSFILHGTKGSFTKARADTQEPRLVAQDHPGMDDWGTEPDSASGFLHTEQNGELIKKFLPTERGSYMGYYEQLYQAIVNNEPLQVSAADGLNVIRIIEKAYQSNQEKRVVPV